MMNDLNAKDSSLKIITLSTIAVHFVVLFVTFFFDSLTKTDDALKNNRPRSNFLVQTINLPSKEEKTNPQFMIEEPVALLEKNEERIDEKLNDYESIEENKESIAEVKKLEEKKIDVIKPEIKKAEVKKLETVKPDIKKTENKNKEIDKVNSKKLEKAAVELKKKKELEEQKKKDIAAQKLKDAESQAEKARQQKLFSEAAEKIARIDGSRQKVIASSGGHIATPSPLIKNLQIDAMPVKVGSPPLSSKEIFYRDEIAARLKSITLPEYGDVKLKLTLNRSGKVVSLVIISAASAVNKTVIEKKLPQLKFPDFGTNFGTDSEYTFSIHLSNE